MVNLRTKRLLKRELQNGDRSIDSYISALRYNVVSFSMFRLCVYHSKCLFSLNNYCKLYVAKTRLVVLFESHILRLISQLW